MLDYYQIGHYAGYHEVGRTEVEPMPIDPDDKKTNRYCLFALYPICGSNRRSTNTMRGANYCRTTSTD